MKRIHILLIVIVMVLTLGTESSRATLIQLELYNSYALVNSDGLTPLVGDASAGDIVQVILAGINGIDAPSQSGGVTGDDQLLFTLHVGQGMPLAGTGMLDVFPLNYDSSLVNTNLYVRFWNTASLGNGTYYYGNSSILQLPPGDQFGLTNLDFAPVSGSPRTTDQPFSMVVIPEPSNLYLFGMLLLGLRTLRRQWSGNQKALTRA